ncbi:hypothetical protein [Virgibacillus kimchii]
MKKIHYKKQHAMYFLVPAMIIILFISYTYDNELRQVVAENSINQDEQETEIKPLEHEQIVRMTDRFMDLILQDIDEKHMVLNYESKEELLEAFEEIAVKEVAKPYVEYYFHEKQDGMYILPTEAPSWFMEENEYDMIQLEENKVKLVQDNFLEMYGAYSIEIEFTYENEWKITEIKHLY